MQTLLISDLHLQASQPRLKLLAFLLFDNIAIECGKLYILGDLFDYWIGDDACDQVAAEVANKLASLTRQGVEVTIMHGNRDFLLGRQFVDSFDGCLVTADTLTIALGGKPTMLLHGDSLCTDDVQYQNFRSTVRKTEWQAEFLSKPASEREATARMIRDTSKAEGQRAHRQNIADINSSALRDTIAASGVTRVIHGHTHRPARHQHDFSTAPLERLVLGDWHEDHAVIALCNEDSCGLLNWNGQNLQKIR